MRFLILLGVALIVLGIVALGYQGFTFFTHDRVAQIGPIGVDAERAHTVWLSPALGAAALVGGIALAWIGARQTRSA